MVDNAGLFRDGSITDLDVADLDAMPGVNVRGALVGT